MKSSIPEQPTPCHCIGPSKSSMAKGDSNRRDFPVQLWNQGQMTAMPVKVSSCLHVFISKFTESMTQLAQLSLKNFALKKDVDSKSRSTKWMVLRSEDTGRITSARSQASTLAVLCFPSQQDIHPNTQLSGWRTQLCYLALTDTTVVVHIKNTALAQDHYLSRWRTSILHQRKLHALKVYTPGQGLKNYRWVASFKQTIAKVP